MPAYRRRLIWGLSLSIAACSTFPHATQTGTVVDVTISNVVPALNVTVSKNDEVRWVNHRQGPVQIVFLDPIEGKISCKRGFGFLDVVNATTIAPGRSVSLCFSEIGALSYTIRFDTALPTRSMNARGLIVVKAPM